MPDDPKVKVWMPLYVGEWDRDTRHLSPEEDGCYFRIIRWYWGSGAPLDDDDELANIVGLSRARWLKVRPKLARFFQVEDGRWTHGKVERIRVEWSDRKAAAAEKAKRAASKRWSKDASGMLQALPEQCPSPSPSSATLEDPAGHSSASGKARFSNLEFREEALERMGPEWVASYVDPAEWQDVPEKLIIARNGTAADRIRRELFPLLRGIKVISAQERAA